HSQQLDGLSRVASVVMTDREPGILIECLKGGSWRRENRADPPARDDLRIGEMRDDLRDGPLLRRGALVQARCRHALYQAVELLRGPRLDGERILFTHITKQPLDVLLGRF